ncbi:MAG: trypsin-like peptidase domain-containing protein [Peptoniphilaceae bacterium]|nr:trypsin-like peptidase domain-containing protein [Peptoniphilaceae bacterium]MDY6019482.1 trypsin-like peptidase domain-containing protein [Anaerococcus sp.]
MNRRKSGILGNFLSGLVGAVIGAFIVLAITGNIFTNKKDNNTQSQSDSDSSSNNIVINPGKDDESMETAVVKKSIDSVVGVTTKTEKTELSFFGPQTGYVEGVGSGSIVSADGYILTNSHVIDDGDAQEINVLLKNGKTMPAKLVWNDTTLDLAIIKVDGKNLPVMEFGDSDKMQVGSRVVAIGNPLGLELQSTVTSGIISGLNRTVSFQTGASMDGLMQTDAAINAGNSGGALLNSKGELIGINTAKAGNSDGIGFAIPANLAKKIVDKVVKTGKFQSVYLGISGVDLSLITNSYNINTKALGTDKGIVVQNVFDTNLKSIKKGDIITAIDDKEVKDMSNLKKVLLDYEVGDSVKIKLYRDGKEKSVDFKFSLDSSSVDAYKGANPNNEKNNSNQDDTKDENSELPFWFRP